MRLGPKSTVQYYVPPRGYKLLSNVWMDVMTRGSETGYATENMKTYCLESLNRLHLLAGLLLTSSVALELRQPSQKSSAVAGLAATLVLCHPHDP